MANRNPNRFEKSLGVWVIIAVLVGLNLWYDWYHPLGFFFDAIIVIVLIVKWPRGPQKTPGGSEDREPGTEGAAH
jgi:hypothetical protein